HRPASIPNVDLKRSATGVWLPTYHRSAAFWRERHETSPPKTVSVRRGSGGPWGSGGMAGRAGSAVRPGAGFASASLAPAGGSRCLPNMPVHMGNYKPDQLGDADSTGYGG